MVETYILLTGIMVFIARVVDVSIGTIRTIATVQGRMVTAFFLGIIEVVLWIVVVCTVIHEIKESPVLILFFAVGFATGNVVGIIVEREIAFGPVILKVITNSKEKEITDVFQNHFLDVTRFEGEGLRGPVTELYVVCHRRDLRILLPAIRKIDANAFFVTEQAREVSRNLKPICAVTPRWLTTITESFRGIRKHTQGKTLSLEPDENSSLVLNPFSPPATGGRSRIKKK